MRLRDVLARGNVTISARDAAGCALSAKIKKKQKIPAAVEMFVRRVRTRGSVSRGQNEADPRVGRWLSLLHFFLLLLLFSSQTARQLVFLLFIFLRFFFFYLFLFPVTSVLLLLVSVEVRGRMRV